MPIPLALALAPAIIQGASAIGGAINSKKAKTALDNLQTPNHQNPAENIQVSTLGSDIIKEEGQRQTGNILNTLQGGDASTMLSALPSLVQMNNQINQQAALNIDKQMINREYQIAQYEGRLNEIKENRYQSDIEGLGAMYNQGQQQMWNGINGAISGMGSIYRGLDSGNSKGLRPEAKTVSTLNPVGVTTDFAYKRTNLKPITEFQGLETEQYIPQISF